MRFKGLWLAAALVVAALGLGGCGGEYKAEIEQINAGVEALGEIGNGHISVTTEVAAENGQVTLYDTAYVTDYYYEIVVKTFNFIAESRVLTDGVPGELMQPPYKVVDAHKYDLTTGVEDEEYDGDIGDFPDLLSFYFGAGLKNSYVGSVELLTDEEHPGWQGFHVVKSDKYVERVNSSRGKHGAEGTMLSSYVDYWLDEAGVLVRMDYVSRDAVSELVGADENGEGGETVEDVINQKYVFEMVAYNDDSIPAMFAEVQ